MYLVTPEIKADTVYVRLMDEIAGSENLITIARENISSAISNYNTKVKAFPTSIVASMLGYTEIAMYNAPSEIQEVKVKFDNTI